MTHTETIGSKSGKGDVITLLTTSTTAAFTEGGLVAIDTDGCAEMCATAEVTACIGVCAAGLRTVDTAARRPLSIQTSGLATVYGWLDSTWTTTSGTAIAPGDLVGPSGDSGTTYTGQVVQCCEGTGGQAIGVALEAVSTCGTRYAIKVILGPRRGGN